MECVRVNPDKFTCHRVTKKQHRGGNPKSPHDDHRIFPDWIQDHIVLEPVFNRMGEEQEGMYRHYVKTPTHDVPMAVEVLEGSWFVGDGVRVWHYSKKRFEAAFQLV